MSNMCWCKDCEHLYKGKCINGLSENHMDEVGDHNSCEHSDIKCLVMSREKFSEIVESVYKTEKENDNELQPDKRLL